MQSSVLDIRVSQQIDMRVSQQKSEPCVVCKGDVRELDLLFFIRFLKKIIILSTSATK